MSSIAKKVKETLEDVKDKAVGSTEHAKEKVEDYAKRVSIKGTNVTYEDK